MSVCSAQQQGDEMACGRCGLRWEVNDPNPPDCLQFERRSRPRSEAAAAVSKEFQEFAVHGKNVPIDRELTAMCHGAGGRVEVAPGCALPIALPPRVEGGPDWEAVRWAYRELLAAGVGFGQDAEAARMMARLKLTLPAA